jgi:hypothetical protein
MSQWHLAISGSFLKRFMMPKRASDIASLMAIRMIFVQWIFSQKGLMG